MNRPAKIGVSSLLAISTVACGGAMAGAAGSATARVTSGQPALGRCTVQHRNYAFPKAAASYQAGAAGAVTVAPVNAATIKVVKASPALGYRAFVDSWRGSSVDVYFRSLTPRAKFEAEINDSGGLTITVTRC